MFKKKVFSKNQHDKHLIRLLKIFVMIVYTQQERDGKGYIS